MSDDEKELMDDLMLHRSEKDEYKDRPAVFYKRYSIARIHDFVKNPHSLALTHVTLDIDGFNLINSRPPASVADHQSKLLGYKHGVLFDQENSAKRIKGARKNDLVLTGQMADKVRGEIETMRKEKRQQKKPGFEPEI